MRHPALALVEFDSVAVGIHAADLMVKRAPIALLKAGTVHPGHYLVLIGGLVAPVTESHQAGIEAGGGLLIDEVLLPDVDPQVHDAALGLRQPLEREALGVLETRTVASLLRAADAGVKGARVRIAEIRLADDLGGRAFVLFDGEVADVEAALAIGAGRVPPEHLLTRTILPRLDGTLRGALTAGTQFSPCAPLEPDGAEQLSQVEHAPAASDARRKVR
jgi:microcompartment protein CcmL/EutN